jgi:hypothetical protein
MESISSADLDKIIVGDLSDDEVNVTSLAQDSGAQQQCAYRAPIKMIYRGSTYYYDPDRAQANRQTRPINQAPYDLIYRGVTYHIDPNAPKPPSTAPRSYQLIYRGCTYQMTRDEAGAVTAITPATKYFKR